LSYKTLQKEVCPVLAEGKNGRKMHVTEEPAISARVYELLARIGDQEMLEGGTNEKNCGH
jgi:hypothetical protein